MTVRRILKPTTKLAKDAINVTSSTAADLFKLAKKTGGRVVRLAGGVVMIVPKTVKAVSSSVAYKKRRPKLRKIRKARK